MKRSISLFFIVPIIVSCVQIPYDPDIDYPDKYEVILELSNMPKNEIFLKANKWFISNFSSENSIILISDKEYGYIIGTIFDSFVDVNTFYQMKFDVNIEIKGNRVRMTFENPHEKYTGTIYGTISTMMGETDDGNDYKPDFRRMTSNKHLAETNRRWRKNAESFNLFMATEDDW
ncbi:DUF4468 domain-containing protein [Sediminispirochaeta smaragdinae]|jgi:hypothetical protein|uniref:DUF4468 domain-containing protein n=1 Tax=Sediminispirochaeta smaragdinae (strain DSM 11293 / JCM 15392 / SEBR 4228) TaxID=573413 RepID=E1RB40_SEDSS|nr:DUF4468 domain-containing protein [Sediminispirochaeta smaragdinae]ADK79570.1 hypothetical protein Spirs_0419 [Sediminispirochaeta smaragdinae DSM 11293]